MNKLIILPLLMILLLMSSCGKATDVTFDSQLSQTSDEIVVNESTQNKRVNTPFSTAFVLSLDNSDTHEYLNQLKDLDLSDVNLSFTGLSGLSGNTTVVDLIITVDNQIVITIPNFNFDMVAQGDPIMITDTQKINQIATRLLDNKKINIEISGSIPSTDTYHFQIKFQAKATITADVL